MGYSLTFDGANVQREANVRVTNTPGSEGVALRLRDLVGLSMPTSVSITQNATEYTCGTGFLSQRTAQTLMSHYGTVAIAEKGPLRELTAGAAGVEPSAHSLWMGREESAQLKEWQRACGANDNASYAGLSTKEYHGAGALDPADVKRRILAGLWERTSQFQPACACGSTERIHCAVLDPFCGSGTTGLAALRHGRSFVGIDVKPEYCELAQKRLEALP